MKKILRIFKKRLEKKDYIEKMKLQEEIENQKLLKKMKDKKSNYKDVINKYQEEINIFIISK